MKPSGNAKTTPSVARIGIQRLEEEPSTQVQTNTPGSRMSGAHETNNPGMSCHIEGLTGYATNHRIATAWRIAMTQVANNNEQANKRSERRFKLTTANRETITTGMAMNAAR
jgi:hypothetical protein